MNENFSYDPKCPCGYFIINTEYTEKEKNYKKKLILW